MSATSSSSSSVSSHLNHSSTRRLDEPKRPPPLSIDSTTTRSPSLRDGLEPPGDPILRFRRPIGCNSLESSSEDRRGRSSQIRLPPSTSASHPFLFFLSPTTSLASPRRPSATAPRSQRSRWRRVLLLQPDPTRTSTYIFPFFCSRPPSHATSSIDMGLRVLLPLAVASCRPHKPQKQPDPHTPPLLSSYASFPLPSSSRRSSLARSFVCLCSSFLLVSRDPA